MKASVKVYSQNIICSGTPQVNYSLVDLGSYLKINIDFVKLEIRVGYN